MAGIRANGYLAGILTNTQRRADVTSAVIGETPTQTSLSGSFNVGDLWEDTLTIIHELNSAPVNIEIKDDAGRVVLAGAQYFPSLSRALVSMSALDVEGEWTWRVTAVAATSPNQGTIVQADLDENGFYRVQHNLNTELAQLVVADGNIPPRKIDVPTEATTTNIITINLRPWQPLPGVFQWKVTR